MVVFAQDEHGRLTHIDGARRGKACNCRCLACGEALIARHGQVKAHSFAHASGTECQYALDALLTRLAKELIAARGSFRTPKLSVRAARTGPMGAIRSEETIPSRNLPVESVSLERRVHRLRPSVVMLVKGRELLLEVTHAHHLDAHKRSAIEKLGVPALELHLSECKFENVAQFERVLIDDTCHKQWIFNPKASEIQLQLDKIVEEQLAQQKAQVAARLARQRHEQAILAAQQATVLAASVARQQEEVEAAVSERLRLQAQRDHLLRRQEQARIESLASAASQKRPEVRRQTLHYRLQDGGLMFWHEPGEHILIVPETGKEQALGVFAQLGLAYDAELGGYRTSIADLPDILPALQSYVVSVRSS